MSLAIIHQSIPVQKMTLFEVVYGISPSSLLAYIPGTCLVQAIDEYL